MDESDNIFTFQSETDLLPDNSRRRSTRGSNSSNSQNYKEAILSDEEEIESEQEIDKPEQEKKVKRVKRVSNIKDNLDDDLFKVVSSKGGSIKAAVNDWVQDCKKGSVGVSMLVNLILHCGGCEEKVSDETEPNSFIAKIQGGVTELKDKKLKKNLESFWRMLVQELCKGLFNCIDDLFEWLECLSRSQYRSIRLSAAIAIVYSISGFCKAKRDPTIDGYINKFFDELFILCFRDVDALVRALCIKELSVWALQRPEKFCVNNALRFFGWLFCDDSAEVRRSAMDSVKAVYQKQERAYCLVTFTERYKKTMIDVALYDSAVRKSAIGLLSAVYASGLIQSEDIKPLFPLFFSSPGLCSGLVKSYLEDVTRDITIDVTKQDVPIKDKEELLCAISSVIEDRSLSDVNTFVKEMWTHLPVLHEPEWILEEWIESYPDSMVLVQGIMKQGKLDCSWFVSSLPRLMIKFVSNMKISCDLIGLLVFVKPFDNKNTFEMIWTEIQTFFNKCIDYEHMESVAHVMRELSYEEYVNWVNPKVFSLQDTLAEIIQENSFALQRMQSLCVLFDCSRDTLDDCFMTIECVARDNMRHSIVSSCVSLLLSRMMWKQIENIECSFEQERFMQLVSDIIEANSGDNALVNVMDQLLSSIFTFFIVFDVSFPHSLQIALKPLIAMQRASIHFISLCQKLFSCNLACNVLAPKIIGGFGLYKNKLCDTLYTDIIKSLLSHMTENEFMNTLYEGILESFGHYTKEKTEPENTATLVKMASLVIKDHIFTTDALLVFNKKIATYVCESCASLLKERIARNQFIKLFKVIHPITLLSGNECERLCEFTRNELRRHGLKPVEGKDWEPFFHWFKSIDRKNKKKSKKKGIVMNTIEEENENVSNEMEYIKNVHNEIENVNNEMENIENVNNEIDNVNDIEREAGNTATIQENDNAIFQEENVTQENENVIIQEANVTQEKDSYDREIDDFFQNENLAENNSQISDDLISKKRSIISNDDFQSSPIMELEYSSPVKKKRTRLNMNK